MMFYFRSNRLLNRRRMVRAFIASAAIGMLAAGIMHLLVTRPMPLDPDAVTMLSIITVILLTLPVGLFISAARGTSQLNRADRIRERIQTRREARDEDDMNSSASEVLEKHKNAAPGMDMYSMIDRMVEELDEDEIAYLRQRLEQRDEAQNPDLPQSIGDLLDKRARHHLEQ